VSAFLRLVARDNTSPLRPTLCNEHSDEIASAMAPVGEAAIRSAIMLLARSENIAARLSAHGLDLHNEHRLVFSLAYFRHRPSILASIPHVFLELPPCSRSADL